MKTVSGKRRFFFALLAGRFHEPEDVLFRWQRDREQCPKALPGQVRLAEDLPGGGVRMLDDAGTVSHDDAKVQRREGTLPCLVDGFYILENLH